MVARWKTELVSRTSVVVLHADSLIETIQVVTSRQDVGVYGTVIIRERRGLWIRIRCAILTSGDGNVA